MDLSVMVAVVLGLIALVWFFFFRGESDTRSSFNPTPGGTTAFKSINVPSTAAKKAAAPKVSKAQRAKDEGKPYVLVLFGSQTGTAEDFGEQLVTEMEGYGIVGDLRDMEDVEGETLEQQKHVIFVVATYGEGEPTDNAKPLWEHLQKEMAPEGAPLKGMQFGVFGLGNKTYEHYNWMGREMQKRLLALGASAILPYGEGDDDSSLEDDFGEWKKQIWGPLCEALGVKAEVGAFESGNHARAWKWQVVFEDAAAPAAATAKRERFSGKVDPKKRAYDKDHPFYTTVSGFRELNAPGCERGCLHAEVLLPKGVRYEEGDHLGLYPVNSAALVERYLKYFGLDGARVCTILGNTDKDRDQPLFGPAPLAQVLATLVDLQDVPRKSVLEKLLLYATELGQEAALRAWLDKHTYQEQVEKRFMTVLEILESLPAPLVVPCHELLQILPPLLPRYYSISSSLRYVQQVQKEKALAAAEPSVVAAAVPIVATITCARVDNVSPTGRVHQGVASHWLYELQRRGGAAVPVASFVRSSTFRMPPSGRPAVMIGPGTGVAPFMGFLQRRSLDSGGARPGDVLFTGFRTHAEFLYREELERWAREGVVELHVAFSREQATKHYVQHDMERHADRIWELIDVRKGNVYICGDANHMEKDVMSTLLRILRAKRDDDEKAAQAYLDKMLSSKQIQKDTWF